MAPGSRRLLLAVVAVAALVRVLHLLAVQATPLFVSHRIWPATDMWIFDQWAQRIVDGDVLGKVPFHPILEWMSGMAPAADWTRWFGEAPVYFKAPLYPYLVALVRWLVGDPALAMAVLQIAVSMASVVVLFLITERLFSTTAAVLAALALAVYAPAIHYDVVLLRGPWIVLASLLVTWGLLRIREAPSVAAHATLGLLVGLSILLNESFTLLPLLVLVAYACGVVGPRRWTTSGAFVAGLVIALSPVVVRNVVVGAPPLQLAVTGAWVVALSNASDSDPILFRHELRSFIPLMEASHARVGRVLWLCLRSFPDPGALGRFYLRRAAGLIVPFENADNASFYHATTISPILDWLPDYTWLFPFVALGLVLALRRRRRGLAAILPVSLVLLASTLLAPPLSRYRLPLIVMGMPFAGLALEHAWRCIAERRVAALASTLALLIGIGLAAGLVERRVVLPQVEPWIYVYRAVDFGVAAGAYETQGRYREAGEEYLRVAARVPRGSGLWVEALLLAAPRQVRSGDRAGARATVDAVAPFVAADPRSLLMLGDVYRQALDDPAAAASAYRRARELRPSTPLASILEARLSELKVPGE